MSTAIIILVGICVFATLAGAIVFVTALIVNSKNREDDMGIYIGEQHE